MPDYLVPHAFFSIHLEENIAKHPFVRKRVIPALEKTHTKQVSILKQKYKKRLSNAKLSDTELNNKIWYFVLNEMIIHYSNLLGKDRGLTFGLFGGGAHNFIVWDNHHKSLYPTNDFSFNLPFSTESEYTTFEDNDEVFFRGKLATAYRDGERYSVLKIYFYVVDNSEKRDPGETTVSGNVGILCEVPFFFLRNDRYETFQDHDTTNQLLELFELKKDDTDYSPPDFIPTDEIGESYGSSSWLEIGNDYAGVNIN
jgi:hypothetical protein